MQISHKELQAKLEKNDLESQASGTISLPWVLHSMGLLHFANPQVFEHWGKFERRYPDEELIRSFIDVLRGYTLTTYDGLMELAQEIAFCEQNGIEGDYVEIGAYKGGSVGLMGLCNMHYGSKRRMIHAFDSFEGLPHAVEQDLDESFDSMLNFSADQKQGKLESTGIVAAGEHFLNEIVFDKVNYPREFVTVHKGWFQITVPAAAPSIDRIALLKLDGDLYESYMVPLNHLYDKVVSGGFVIIDDWVFRGCRDAINEFFDARGGVPYLHHCDLTVRVIRKP